MIPWLILAVIIVLAFFFFISKPQQSSKEVVLKPRLRKTDTEFAKEDELERFIEMDISEGKKYENQKNKKSLNHYPLKEHGLRKKDVETGDLQLKGKTYDLKLNPGNKIKADDDSEKLTTYYQYMVLTEEGEEDGHEISTELTPVDLQPISGHDMPIEMELVPILLAFAKDPQWIHLFWLLPENCPAGNLEIKVINLSTQEEFFQRVNPNVSNWYIRLGQPDTRFIFELGVWDEEGVFHPLLRSNEVLTPRDRPSDILDSEWMIIDELYQQNLIISPEGSPEFIMEKGKTS